MSPETEPDTYADGGQITARQALERAREASVRTRRRWPAVRAAAADLSALRTEYDPPTAVLTRARSA